MLCHASCHVVPVPGTDRTETQTDPVFLTNNNEFIRPGRGYHSASLGIKDIDRSSRVSVSDPDSATTICVSKAYKNLDIDKYEKGIERWLKPYEESEKSGSPDPSLIPDSIFGEDYDGSVVVMGSGGSGQKAGDTPKSSRSKRHRRADGHEPAGSQG